MKEFRPLIDFYIGEFNRLGEDALKNICNCKIPSQVILNEYKKFTPIEELTIEEKNELWEYAKEKYPNGDNETRLRFIRITYTIGNLI